MAGRGDGQTRSNGQQRAACRDLACRRHRQDHPERGVENPVLVDGIGRARIVTLNRPKQLNALSFQMVSELLRLFVAYENDPGVKLVILKGKGRAFCAGGDVSAVVHSINEDSWKAGAQFFWNEFILNYIIATYSKPQVSILDGIVFGGGAGVSIHGMFRIATENSVFAMPETALGLFPDIGASYFLSRLPGYFGEYVGLTGVRLDGAEMLACGLATHFVSSKVLPLLEESLVSADTSDLSAISAVIDKFSEKVPLPKGCAYRRLDVIDRCFSKGSVEEIIVALMEEFDNNDDEWIRNALQSLKKASPCSLKITLRSIREGRMQGIGECLKTDYRMCCHVLRKDVSKDFFEGCRAILIDKDKNPKVLVDGIGRARIVTLNRPKQLNALSFQMVSELLRLFVAYENDPGVKLVILKGKGRAFCAGGDVSAVVHSINEDSWKAGAQFFWNEFILNYIIATYSKPQVSILDGIVFGGGAGVSIHGMFRIATENSWEPSSLELVTDEMVDCHFAEVNDDEWEDLRFPHRWSSKRCGFSRL